MKINTNVAPKELIVGVSGNLCYVTYKDSKGKLNSEKSWTNWSDNSDNPLVIENKFANGFKLAGVNGRWSSQASNTENMLIEHPLFNKCFEISMQRFIEIAKRCVINNGVFDVELIMTNTRDIVFLDEYKKLDKLDLEKQAKLKYQKEKNSKNNIQVSELRNYNKIMHLQEHIIYLKRDMSRNKYSCVQRFKRISVASYLIAHINGNSTNLNRREYINSKFLTLFNDHLRFVKRSEKGKYPGSTSRFLEDRRIKLK